ncbi:glycosyltransferase family 2 protein [Paraburkholderia largidicola]|uniref:Glycosyltransferase 2-like domain-containing protein n=1 Tax=Paraburkholderia largidicola TaxID=3014751 RepID=A0A7I8BL08_9BURK|nr:glycosyltransferase family 2 protein [Paraburkholderia sp. PGU16]BCF89417.1 hypothetical protein PPGU16_24840 [Paraburkholderia sp. PGU16]
MRWRSLLATPRQFYRGVHEAIQVRGGVAPVARGVIDVVRRDGAKGLRGLFRRATIAAEYPSWIEQYDTIDDVKRAELRASLAGLLDRPRISIVVPVYNTLPDHLREMIESVRSQIYDDWELCICDDASNDARVEDTLREYAQRDLRIKYVRRTVNGHICAASNDALALATGRYVALLDHDDVLAEHALAMIVLYLGKYPRARMLFSDEDKLAPDAGRVEPYFKGEWDPILMLGQNMFSHLGVFETALLREVGGFRYGFEGSQDHDLVLRCSELVAAGEIVHIPHVLYHWRLTPASTARDVGAKPYARDASLRAVREHLERCGRVASVQPLRANTAMIRTIFRVPEPEPMVSIIIPTRDKPELLARCIDSLLALTDYRHFEVLIVDNGSTDEHALRLLEGYARNERITVLRIDAPFNYSALNNAAVVQARGSLLCLLNNDIEIVDGDWLRILCGYALQPDAGAVGAALWYPDDTMQHGGVALAGGSIAGHRHHRIEKGAAGYFGRAVLAQQVAAVSAACLVVRKAVYEEVGGLDADNLKVAYNDVDFCLKLHDAGYRNVFVPFANLYHHESATRGNDAHGERAKRLTKEADWMLSRWRTVLENDPFHNPNLCVANGRFFSLAFPPRVGQFD